MVEKDKVLELLANIKAECGDHKIRTGIDRCIDAVSGLEEEGDDLK